MQYDEGLAKLESRARLATAVLWAFVAVGALTAFSEVLEATGTLNIAVDTGPLALAVGLVYMAFTLVFVVSVIVVAMWLHRAHANLRDAGLDGLEFSPGWAVGWYFIPFANLFMPFQAMRELWNSSHGQADVFGGEAPSEVKVWWGTWIVGNILSNVGTRILMMGEGGPGSVTVGNAIGAAGTALVIIAGVLLVRLIQGVTQAQRGGITAVGVFA
jgi:hypothetical protein